MPIRMRGDDQWPLGMARIEMARMMAYCSERSMICYAGGACRFGYWADLPKHC
jgi:hypothetical protein